MNKLPFRAIKRLAETKTKCKISKLAVEALQVILDDEIYDITIKASRIVSNTSRKTLKASDIEIAI